MSPKTQIMLHRLEFDLIEARYINYLETEKKQEEQLAIHGVPSVEQELLASASMNALNVVTVVKPDRILSGTEIIHTGVYDLQAILTPGHSPGHLCFYEPVNGFLFCGDHILPTITPNISSHTLSGPNPLGSYISSFDRLAALQVNEVHPGHEYSFPDLKARIKELLEHHRARGNEILDILKRHPSSAYEVASHLTWNVRNLTFAQFSPWFKRMATTEVVAHLEYLESQRRIYEEIKDGHVFYSIFDFPQK